MTAHGYSSIENKETDEELQTRGKLTITRMRRAVVVAFLALVLLTVSFVSNHSSFTQTQPSSYLYSAKGLKRLRSKHATAEEGCTVDVMIFRHCEKGNLRSHCTPEGLRRASYLSTLFGSTPSSRWPTPLALYARPPEGNRQVMREIELLTPLSEKTGLQIQSNGYEIKNKIDMVEDIFQGISSGEWCGGVVVISWKHENIPKLSNQLGCGPLQGCPSHYPVHEFDQLSSIRYMYSTPEFSSKKNGKVEEHPIWTVSGSTQYMGFDIVREDKIRKEELGGE